MLGVAGYQRHIVLDCGCCNNGITCSETASKGVLFNIYQCAMADILCEWQDSEAKCGQKIFDVPVLVSIFGGLEQFELRKKR